jgi:hypothetical protein
MLKLYMVRVDLKSMVYTISQQWEDNSRDKPLSAKDPPNIDITQLKVLVKPQQNFALVILSLRALSRQQSSSHGTSNTICASIICQSRSRRDKEH